MKVVLTGAAGFVGRRLADRLVLLGHEVFAIDVVDPKVNGVEFIQADIGESIEESCTSIPQNATFIHLAAISTDSTCRDDPLLALRTNILGTARLALLANATFASKFIFASSEWVYPESEIVVDHLETTKLFANRLPSLYAMTKLTGEGLVENLSNVPSISLRFGIVYGPRETPGSAPESILMKVRNGEAIEVGNGDTARRFIFVDDLCDGLVSALHANAAQGHQIYNLAGSELVSLSKIISEAQKICGVSASFSELGSPASIRNPISDRLYTDFDFEPQVTLRSGLQSCLQKLL